MPTCKLPHHIKQGTLTHTNFQDTIHVPLLSTAAYYHLLPIYDNNNDVLTKVFISADSSLVTTANLRKAAPISGSWSLLSALPPSLSRDRDRYISLSTCAGKRETTRQFVHPRQILYREEGGYRLNEWYFKWLQRLYSAHTNWNTAWNGEQIKQNIWKGELRGEGEISWLI